MKATALSRVSRHADQFIVRLPDGMRDRIAEAAKANGRSMNAEIVHRLEQSFTQQATDAVAQIHAMVTEIRAEFDQIKQKARGGEFTASPIPKRRRKP